MKLDDLCSECRDEMHTDIEEQWKVIKQILDRHDYPKHESGVLICFNKSQSDFKKVLTHAKEQAAAASATLASAEQEHNSADAKNAKDGNKHGK